MKTVALFVITQMVKDKEYTLLQDRETNSYMVFDSFADAECYAKTIEGAWPNCIVVQLSCTFQEKYPIH